MKFYAVKKGRQPGIYRTWAAAKLVQGFSGVQYHAFNKVTDAAAYLNWNLKTHGQTIKQEKRQLGHAFSRQKVESTKSSRSYFATIYTDGGSRNTGVYCGGHVHRNDQAAWAFRIEWKGQEFHKAGGRYGATNNQMELQALIEAMQKVQDLGFANKPLLFVLDSQYVLQAITRHWLQGWQRNGFRRSSGPLANAAQWRIIAGLLPKFSAANFQWTKGHAHNAGNNFVDHLLNQYMDEHMHKRS